MKNLFFLLFSVVLFSCSAPKDITYFQDLDKHMDKLNEIESKRNEFRIKSGDNLVITVSAPIKNQEAVAQFNLPLFSYLTVGDETVNQSTQLQTYTVNEDGNVDFPVLGKIELAGKTKFEAIDFLKNKVSAYVTDPVVNIQLSSFGVAVLGEVLQPMYVRAKNERLTILEALSEAGDMTIFGNRTNVLVIREVNGNRKYARLDLTSAETLMSPYYYLQQGDAVIVEPNKAKKRSSKYGTAENYMLSVVSLSFTALTLLASILTLTKK